VVRVYGDVLRDIHAEPEGGVALGARRVGESAEQTIMLRSLSGLVFDITGVETTGADLEVKSARESPRGAHAFVVRLNVDRPGLREGTIRFKLRTWQGAETLAVAVTGYGYYPSATTHRPEGH
jgi:hypothetical protein